jgi:anti-sigma B factor antagonist
MSQGGRRRRLVVEEDINGVNIVSFVDRKILDEAVIQQLGEELASLADGPRRILLHFGNVEYLSSAALGKLITLQKNVKAVGGALRFCRVHPQIYEIFKITKLNKVFDMHDDEQSALEDF